MNNYISPEEFLKQSKKVQDILLDWWKPQMYDLFFRNFGNNENYFLNGIWKSCIQDNETLIKATNDNTFLPLLQIHQLIQFIEKTINNKIEIFYINKRYVIKEEDSYYRIEKVNCLERNSNKNIWVTNKNNLLQALWQITCEIIMQK